MKLLILGVLLWSLVHLAPAVPMGIRTMLAKRLGEGFYKGIAGLLVLASIALMTIGWKSLPREFLYELPFWADYVCGLAMLAMSILFFAPYMPNNISRFLRHPQLTGIILWGAGHVLASGQLKSLVLFGGISAWAVMEILLINRRDREWERPAPVSVKSDIALLVAGLGFFMLFAFTHEILFGAGILSE